MFEYDEFAAGVFDAEKAHRSHGIVAVVEMAKLLEELYPNRLDSSYTNGFRTSIRVITK